MIWKREEKKKFAMCLFSLPKIMGSLGNTFFQVYAYSHGTNLNVGTVLTLTMYHVGTVLHLNLLMDFIKYIP